MGQSHEYQPVVEIERTSGGIGAFLTGVAFGAGLALLLAPRSGEELREELRARARRLRDAAEDRIEDLQDAVEGGYERTKASVEAGLERAREHLDDGKESAREAIEVAREVGAERTVLTHLTHRSSHEALLARLPEGIEPAYDGMSMVL